jgi:hypothetical protein
MSSWKTTLAGIAAVLASLAVSLKAVVAGDYATAVTAAAGISAGIGLIFARDNNVTSEKAGAV